MTVEAERARHARVREVFAGHAFLKLLGASLDTVVDGRVAVSVRRRDDLVQQHGFVHGGVIATIADTAAGLAALTIASAERDVLTADLSVNLLRPAVGELFVADAQVVRAGRTLTVCRVDVTGVDLCAVATATLAHPPVRQEG